MYGPRGFAPWLPALLWRLRRSTPRPTLGVVVHEPYVPMDSWRRRAMGLAQRVQLFAIASSVDVIYASIESWTGELQRRHLSTACRHFPMGSTLPSASESRQAARARLGIEGDALVLAALGTGHPSRRLPYIRHAANAVAWSGRRVVFLNLGDSAPVVPGLDDAVVVNRPGGLPPDALAGGLAAADIFLAPFVDGASTRRTSLMAALQHGLAVVATDGPLTDGIWRDQRDAIRLVPLERLDRFVAAVQELAADATARIRIGAAACELYQRCFDWPVAAQRLLDGLRQPLASDDRAAVALEANAGSK